MVDHGQVGRRQIDVARDHGDYPQLVPDLLTLGGLDADVVTYDLQRDGGPATLDGHDGWIISGSVSSAYEDEAWIRDLEGLCRTLLDRFLAGGGRFAWLGAHDEAAHGLYARLGFRRVGHQLDFSGPDA